MSNNLLNIDVGSNTRLIKKYVKPLLLEWYYPISISESVMDILDDSNNMVIPLDDEQFMDY